MSDENDDEKTKKFFFMLDWKCGKLHPTVSCQHVLNAYLCIRHRLWRRKFFSKLGLIQKVTTLSFIIEFCASKLQGFFTELSLDTQTRTQITQQETRLLSPLTHFCTHQLFLLLYVAFVTAAFLTS
jgi:hypothetical protein